MPITDSLVLVTGATGFVAAELVKQLLESGYRVRGTTRDVAKAHELGHLTSLPGAAERLELVAADLNHSDAFDKLIADCEFVIHTASPYTLRVKDAQRDLVDPAVNGTLSVLESAAKTSTVKRVVLTSSFAAISGAPRAETFSEADWNTVSSLDNGPYAYSKTLAERAAWDFMESHDRHFDLVVMNPTGVVGPSVVHRLNQTHEFMVGMTNGQSPAIIDIGFPIVDVRDVARAHIAGIENPSASGRYLLSAGSPRFRRYVEIKDEIGLGDKHRLPRLPFDNPVGTVIVRGLMMFQPKSVRQFVNSNLGAHFDLDTSKAERELGISWIDTEDTIRDAALDLDRWGHLGKK